MNLREAYSEKSFSRALLSRCEMNRKTHNRIAKIILPDVDTRIIDRINKRMDRPETWAPVVSPALGKVPRLSYRGHRRQGHDVITAARIGFEEGV